MPAPFLDPAHDPDPVEVIPGTGDVLLVCEHAGRAIPRALGDLGIAPEEMDRHIAWDIGAEALARELAARIGATLVLQRYSRLVIDCNRPPLGLQSIPEESDGTPVPANRGLSAAEKGARVADIFDPFALAVHRAIVAPGLRLAVSIHSFTPALAGVARPWHAGFCARQDGYAKAAIARLSAEAGLTLAVNQPYQIDDETDWFIPRAAEPSGLPHALIEIRNDGLRSDADIARWADRLVPCLTELP